MSELAVQLVALRDGKYSIFYMQFPPLKYNFTPHSHLLGRKGLLMAKDSEMPLLECNHQVTKRQKFTSDHKLNDDSE